MGEGPRKALAGQNGAIALDTFGGRIHVEWDPAAAVTPLGQLPFFIEFLKVSGVFEAWVADCPLVYQSNHASDKRAVLATLLLSILAGHHRYAHITAIRYDGIHPELLGVSRLVSEDAARRALARIDESSGVAWLDRAPPSSRGEERRSPRSSACRRTASWPRTIRCAIRAGVCRFHRTDTDSIM